MKKPGASFVLLTPDAHGWRVRLPGGGAQSHKTLEEVAATLPAQGSLHLALPCQAALIERLKLPSTERDELEGMLLLQLEKTLPFPVEDVSNGFEIIESTEAESTIVSISTNNAQLDRLCAPLRARGRLPEKVTVYALHFAATCPPDAVVLCVWAEDEQLALAICEHGKLSYAQTLPGLDAATLLAELPAFMLSAEMEGVPTQFASVRLEQGSGGLRDHLAEYFSVPVEIISYDVALPEVPINLVPDAWIAETRRLERSGAVKQRLQLAAALYLLLVAAACIYLVLQKQRAAKIDVQLAQLQPQVDTTRKQQTRWLALAPAIDPTRYAVEIVHLLFSNRPSGEVKFTEIVVQPTEFRVEGEAPDPDSAVKFIEKLRKESGLNSFKINADPPTLLAKSAKFVVTGKLL